MSLLSNQLATYSSTSAAQKITYFSTPGGSSARRCQQWVGVTRTQTGLPNTRIWTVTISRNPKQKSDKRTTLGEQNCRIRGQGYGLPKGQNQNPVHNNSKEWGVFRSTAPATMRLRLLSLAASYATTKKTSRYSFGKTNLMVANCSLLLRSLRISLIHATSSDSASTSRI